MATIMRLSVIAVFSLFVLSLFFLENSNALVTISGVRVNTNLEEGLTSGVIETGSGLSNYELLFCGIETDGSNPFNAPTPGTWKELNNDVCGDPFCHLGIWGRVVDSLSSEEITCSWGDEAVAFVASSIRFQGVDTDNPIIDIACSEFRDGFYFLDAVASEPGAQFVSLQLIVRLGDSGDEIVEFDQLSSRFVSNVKFTDDLILSLAGSSVIDKDGAGNEGFVIPPLLDIFNTQFCNLTIRMAKDTKNIPTISEWGLIATAGIMGILALIVLRKRKSVI